MASFSDPLVVVGFESLVVFEDPELAVAIEDVEEGVSEEEALDEDMAVVAVAADDEEEKKDVVEEEGDEEDEKEVKEEEGGKMDEEPDDVPSSPDDESPFEELFFLITPVAIQTPMITMITATTANTLKPIRIKLHRRFLFLFTVCNGTVGSAVICPIWLLW